MKGKILSRYQNDPQGVLERIGIYGLKYGYREAKGCCHLHDDDSPSFSINLQSGLWKCFAGCGQGDLFILYRQIKSVDGNFYELLKEMENQL